MLALYPWQRERYILNLVIKPSFIVSLGYHKYNLIDILQVIEETVVQKG